jgi:hypothetical protein
MVSFTRPHGSRALRRVATAETDLADWLAGEGHAGEAVAVADALDGKAVDLGVEAGGHRCRHAESLCGSAGLANQAHSRGVVVGVAHRSRQPEELFLARIRLQAVTSG